MNKLFEICQQDPRYDLEAYLFLREALEFTVQKAKKTTSGPQRHVTGRELAIGFKQYALEQFGPITFAVLAKWGLHCTDDIGSMVFNLVESGELGKTDEDKVEDFHNLYDFQDAFLQPFVTTRTEEPST
jgi:uncharacterized repeat protein (TIGR04138 family)